MRRQQNDEMKKKKVQAGRVVGYSIALGLFCKDSLYVKQSCHYPMLQSIYDKMAFK
jgi:hypothetical protein